MILALDTITLAQVTDIQGIYRYYQLATAKPSVPSVYPPASPWTLTEPEYQSTNQGSLYYVDVTYFSDTTWQYSEVQMSSDYEAVKSTYADALQQIAEAESRIDAKITEGDESLRQAVVKTYYSKEDVDTKIAEVGTTLDQTVEGWNFQFNSLKVDIDNTTEGLQSQIGVYQKYIRLVDGTMIFGEEGSAVTLTLENDILYFTQNGERSGYFANNKSYMKDLEADKVTIGKQWRYVTRSDGSLDFKKVTVSD